MSACPVPRAWRLFIVGSRPLGEADKSGFGRGRDRRKAKLVALKRVALSGEVCPAHKAVLQVLLRDYQPGEKRRMRSFVDEGTPRLDVMC